MSNVKVGDLVMYNPKHWVGTDAEFVANEYEGIVESFEHFDGSPSIDLSYAKIVRANPTGTTSPHWYSNTYHLIILGSPPEGN